VQAVIWGTDGRAEGPATPSAAVTTAPTLRGSIERMDHDIVLGEPVTEREIAIRTAAAFEDTSSHETCSDV
jgi:hypothetical protein